MRISYSVQRYCLSVLICLLLVLSGKICLSETNILVQGDDIQVSREDVEKVKNYFKENTPFRTKQKEYIRYTLELKLFAKEAKSLGLNQTQDTDRDASEKECNKGLKGLAWLYALSLHFNASEKECNKGLEGLEVEELIRLSNLYITHLLKEHPVNDNVIRSYYRAFPEKFRLEKKGENSKQNSTKQIMPLDQELKTKIRNEILSAKIKEVRKKAFENLKKKYNIDHK